MPTVDLLPPPDSSPTHAHTRYSSGPSSDVHARGSRECVKLTEMNRQRPQQLCDPSL